MNNEEERSSRAITTYSSMLSLLGMIATGGLAATATILQIVSINSYILIGSAGLFLLSLILCLIAMTCLIGQAKNQNPNIYSNKLSNFSFCSIASMAVAVVLLFLGILNSDTNKKSANNDSCICNCNTSTIIGSTQQKRKMPFCQKD